ncbi:Olfactory receptor 7G1 [Sciurus carolinensis]|uniref:Olfactory receptor 7G1 n=1 Tax=Sciurus carolinensis TaxID=30640 RepID=A0AA41MPR8_SCICA|nr:Olfactory receptor 7G1 [Sciurus carolinensis]
MKPTNQSAVSEFLLLGLTKDPALQSLIFSLFLSMYLVTILGNLLIILALCGCPPYTLMLLRLSFCADLEIPHFFCELAQVIKLACSDTSVDNVLIYVTTCMFDGIPLSGIFSYIHIVSSVLRTSSSRGKHKPFLPTLNPFIHSLRNRDLKEALRNLI